MHREIHLTSVTLRRDLTPYSLTHSAISQHCDLPITQKWSQHAYLAFSTQHWITPCHPMCWVALSPFPLSKDVCILYCMWCDRAGGEGVGGVCVIQDKSKIYGTNTNSRSCVEQSVVLKSQTFWIEILFGKRMVTGELFLWKKL